MRGDKHTVLQTDAEDYATVEFDKALGLGAVVMTSLEQGLAWPVLNDFFGAGTENHSSQFKKDKDLHVQVLYGPVDKGIEQVQVLVPGFGVALGVPFVDEAHSGGVKVEQLVSEVLGDGAGKTVGRWRLAICRARLMGPLICSVMRVR